MMNGKSVSLIVAIVLTVIVLVAGCGDPEVNPERTAPPLDADGFKKLQGEAEKVKAAEPEDDNDTDGGSK